MTARRSRLIRRYGEHSQHFMLSWSRTSWPRPIVRLRGRARRRHTDACRRRHRDPAQLSVRSPILSRPEIGDAAVTELARSAGCRRRQAYVRNNVDVVRKADGRGIGQVVDDLVVLGHRRMSHLSGGGGKNPSGSQSGYVRAMKRDGLSDASTSSTATSRSAQVCSPHRSCCAGDDADRGLCANDQSAIGLLDQLLRAGVDVPGDIAVAGYDDSGRPGSHTST